MTIALYSIAGGLLLLSIIFDIEKTKKALKSSLRTLKNLLSPLVSIMILTGFIITLLSAETINSILGSQSGILGIIIGILLGSVAMIPSFVAYPLAASLLDYGAGYAQVAAFICSLMIVVFATLPLEIKYFGKKATILRAILCIIVSFTFALIVGAVM